jgi:hypothetical protein
VKEGKRMLAVPKRVVALYVDKASQQWVVRESGRSLWSLASTDNPWEGRRPFTPAEGTDLEPVPGHYRQMLGLPP